MAARKVPAGRPKQPSTTLQDTTLHSAPSVRPYTDWDPKKLRLAERMAEQGNLTYAASLCEWLLGDDRVSGALSARTDALMGLVPSFEEGTGRRSKQAVKALEAGEDFWEAYPEAQLTQLVTWGVLLGVALSEQKPWTARPDHDGRMLPSLEFWHPQGLEWDWQLKRWTIRDANGVTIEVTLDGSWILHTPYGEQRPWAYGLWRSLARWVLLKQYAIGDWGRHSEKAATLVATAPVNATKAQRKELAEDLAKAGEDRVVALANGFDLKLVELSANTREIYQAQIEMADLAIAIRIRGGNLSTNTGDKGSYAAAKSQATTGDAAKLRFDASALSTTLHDQSLVYWAQFNFGDRRLAPWPVYPVEPEEDKSARATMVKTLGEGLTIFDKLGFDIDPKAVQEEFGLTFLTGRSREREPDPVLPTPGDEGDDKGTDDKDTPRALAGLSKRGRRGQVVARVDPKADPAPVPAPADKGDDPPPEDPSARLEPLRTAFRALASAASNAANSGFLDGQAYVDELVAAGTRDGVAEMAGELEQILALIDSVESFAELEHKLNGLYKDIDPERMEEIVERYVMLAELAGRAAVLQDT